MVPLILSILLSLTSYASPLNACPKCGTTQVPYPLSTTPDCGNPNYKLSCNNHTLLFSSAGNFTYKVLTISPNTNTLIIQPPIIDQSTCQSSDLGLNGFRIEDDSPFNISKSNTVMLFNCSENILLSPLNCSSISPCRLLAEQGIGCRNRLCCSYLKDSSMTSRQIRLRIGGCSAYTCVVDFKPRQTVDAWNFGIELQWLPPN
ncbi:hypothetical protein BUALT_Bualt15G0119300 [Buddleja alternifolia]|uniref:Wall-associated receptor kinase galacturonan-binding domain-containing protein n=1 Tax=Buddleja alternifolia TaxID=168488 RepID=A0AAV6WCY8_9LAMI|nr:hypothetical protein BUALT_Bualt15G0119300 [Buddleja alternifolia]